MKFVRLWMDISWRMAAAITAMLVLFGPPAMYILLSSTPLKPWQTITSWRIDHWGIRVLLTLLFIMSISLLIGLMAARAASTMDYRLYSPFQDIATILRQIGTGDFRARIEPLPRNRPRELVEIREALNTMAADLERAEELRNNLMADVSHELRTPLTALEGNLRAALDRVYPLDEAEIANLYSQTRHLIRLVNDLHELALADARQLPLDLRPTDLGEVLEETLALFTPLAEEQQVALRAHMAELPLLAIDSARIRQVLHNFLSNALRHTPAGGTITVTSRVEDTTVLVAIADTGDGLEPDQLSAIFNRFYRTDRSRSRDTGGTGLGLAIVSAIIASHGGTVAAASAGLGQGSRFEFRLPIQVTLATETQDLDQAVPGKEPTHTAS